MIPGRTSGTALTQDPDGVHRFLSAMEICGTATADGRWATDMATRI
jgi:hypothetical protein